MNGAHLPHVNVSKPFKIDLLSDVTLSVQFLGLFEQKGVMPRERSRQAEVQL